MEMQVQGMLTESRASEPQLVGFSAAAGQPSVTRQHRIDAAPGAPEDSMATAELDGIYPSTEIPREELPRKSVSFRLVLDHPNQQRSRLPLTVDIHPHDTTDSIITTARNFFGLYDRRGVVFEDSAGNTLIARYENFRHQMQVTMRVTAEQLDMDDCSQDGQLQSPRRSRLRDGYQMPPPTLDHRQPSLSHSRMTVGHSQSPQSGRGRRSDSASTNNRSRARHATKSRGPSSPGSFADGFADGNSFSDSDSGNGSVSSSRRGRKEQVVSAEISVENIVEGGRRKRQKFDSSELPLFIPPQVPDTTSLSSISPQRRVGSYTAASPYSLGHQQTFAFSQPLQSPQSQGLGEASYLNGLVTPHATSTGGQGWSRTRGSGHYAPYPPFGNGSAALPTPDSTLSAISDEDVARQLMRLGDASNLPPHGRNSTSTIDDALSRNGQLSSASDEDDSDGEKDFPRRYTSHGRHPSTTESCESGGEEWDNKKEEPFFKTTAGSAVFSVRQDTQPHTGGAKSRPSVTAKAQPGKPRPLSKAKGKSLGTARQPMSPTSLPPPARKAPTASNHQHQLAADEDDLSTKPRCTRCRSSKKGCDRQRPCQRCKDAGLTIADCISEDETNGRKGRYGRHMGVPVKKQQMAPPAMHGLQSVGAPAHMTAAPSAGEKSKKRKR